MLYHPILTTLLTSPTRVAIALGAFALVEVWKLAPWIVVVASAALGALAGGLP